MEKVPAVAALSLVDVLLKRPHRYVACTASPPGLWAQVGKELLLIFNHAHRQILCYYDQHISQISIEYLDACGGVLVRHRHIGRVAKPGSSAPHQRTFLHYSCIFRHFIRCRRHLGNGPSTSGHAGLHTIRRRLCTIQVCRESSESGQS